jgi:hypothetical protein
MERGYTFVCQFIYNLVLDHFRVTSFFYACMGSDVCTAPFRVVTCRPIVLQIKAHAVERNSHAYTVFNDSRHMKPQAAACVHVEICNNFIPACMSVTTKLDIRTLGGH